MHERTQGSVEATRLSTIISVVSFLLIMTLAPPGLLHAQGDGSDAVRSRAVKPDRPPGDVERPALSTVESAAAPGVPCALLNGSVQLTGVNVFFGQWMSGGLEQLIASDDDALRARSRFGFTALTPNMIDLRIAAQSANVHATAVNVHIEFHINHPLGVASVRLRNWHSQQFELVHSYLVGVPESSEFIKGINAGAHVRADDGRIELSHRTVVLAVFTAAGFDAYYDQIEITLGD